MSTSETNIAARTGDGVEVYYHQSTLPSEQVLKAYETFHHGAAKIMLDMAVAEQKAENEIARRDSQLEFVIRVCGLVFAFVLTLALIVSGTIMVMGDHNVSGCISIFTGILCVIGSIAAGGRNSKRDAVQ